MSSAKASTTLPLLSTPTVIFILFMAAFYICLIAFSLNYRLVIDTLNAIAPVSYKAKILWELFFGIFSAFGWLEGIVLLINGLLVGINLFLILKTIQVLQHSGPLKLSIGGATLLSLVTTGCGVCGLSILSFLGVSTILSSLPFRGLEIHVLSLIVLLFSAVYMVRKLLEAKLCKLV